MKKKMSQIVSLRTKPHHSRSLRTLHLEAGWGSNTRMNEKQLNPLGINMKCLERMVRFVEQEMAADEAMTFAAHFQDCFECRDFAENLRSLLDWRVNIRKLIKWEELGRQS